MKSCLWQLSLDKSAGLARVRIEMPASFGAHQPHTGKQLPSQTSYQRLGMHLTQTGQDWGKNVKKLATYLGYKPVKENTHLYQIIYDADKKHAGLAPQTSNISHSFEKTRRDQLRAPSGRQSMVLLSSCTTLDFLLGS